MVGIIGQYASNPALLAEPRSDTSGALVLNLPINLDLDGFHFGATPSARYGNATGYSSLTSNYFHFDTSAQFANDLGSTTLTGALYRDSSLLYAGEIQNGVGVRRDTSSADVAWLRALNETDQLQLDLSTSRTLFAQSDVQDALSSLVDYRYSSFTPVLSSALSERNTIQVIGGLSRYQAINGVTSSDSASLQLGFSRLLSELWTLKMSAGDSKSNNGEKYYFGPSLLGKIETSQNSTVYSANLIRQGEGWVLNIGASQALAPTGFAYLTRQQSLTLLASYNYSERWTFNSSVSVQNNSNPLTTGGTLEAKYYNASITANWQWTEQWVLTLQAIKVADRYGDPASTGSSTGVSVQIARQFYRLDL